MENIYPLEGLTEIWASVLADQTLKLKLFTNDYTPDANTELADLTEAAWTGYAEESMAPGDIASNAIVGVQALMVFNAFSFANGSGGDVTAYGYYITNNAETVVMQAVRFDSPRTAPDGGTIDVIPTLSAFSEN